MLRRFAVIAVAPAFALAMALSLAYAAPASAATPAPLIVIDPGHGGPYSNANANGLREETVNLWIALELRKQLLAKGYRVVMTRTTDTAVSLSDIPTWNWSDSAQRWYYSADRHTGNYSGIPKDDLQARANVANKLGADLFICIHNNGAASTAARGTETFASSRDALGVKLSRLVHSGIVSRTGLYDRKAQTNDFYVLRWTNMPAVLVEAAFISNPSDAYKLKQSWFRARIAGGIVDGIDKYYAAKPVTRLWPRTTATRTSSAAAAISRTDFPTGAPVAVIARADRFAASAGAPALAAKLGGPLLWAGVSKVPTYTMDELARLKPKRLYLVGPTGTFDATHTAALRAATALPASALVRVGGADAQAVCSSIAATIGVPSAGHVVFASVDDTASIQVAVPVSTRGIPLLLVKEGKLDSAGLALVKNNQAILKQATLVGLAEDVPTSVGALFPATVRYASTNTADRAARVNARYYGSTAKTLRPLLADFTYPFDYLTAASHAAEERQPVMPTSGPGISGYSREWLTNRRPAVYGFEVFDARNTIPQVTDWGLKKADYE